MTIILVYTQYLDPDNTKECGWGSTFGNICHLSKNKDILTEPFLIKGRGGGVEEIKFIIKLISSVYRLRFLIKMKLTSITLLSLVTNQVHDLLKYIYITTLILTETPTVLNEIFIYFFYISFPF